MARTTNGFNMMRVKCQDLLQFEIDNAKAIKGRKVITQSKKPRTEPYRAKIDKAKERHPFALKSSRSKQP